MRSSCLYKPSDSCKPINWLARIPIQQLNRITKMEWRLTTIPFPSNQVTYIDHPIHLIELIKMDCLTLSKFQWHNIRLPSISRHDLRYVIMFITAAAVMSLSSVASLISFCIEKNSKRNDTMANDLFVYNLFISNF